MIELNDPIIWESVNGPIEAKVLSLHEDVTVTIINSKNFIWRVPKDAVVPFYEIHTGLKNAIIEGKEQERYLEEHCNRSKRRKAR